MTQFDPDSQTAPGTKALALRTLPRFTAQPGATSPAPPVLVDATRTAYRWSRPPAPRFTWQRPQSPQA
jgi:hypothetical protein